jgi:CarD family transcriptional regulator
VPAHQEAVVINWSKRNKEYMGKLRTGDIAEIGVIYRNLKYIEAIKGLSFGEKNLLKQTEIMLIEEIALVTDIGQETAEQYVRSLIQKQPA